MNIEDLAKMAISEIKSEFDAKDNKEQEFTPTVEEFEEKNTQNEHEKIKKELKKATQEIMQELEELEEKEIPIVKEVSQEKDPIINNEEFFLKNIRERILVLFEGLKNTKDEHLEKRLEITISFLEFLLAKIEDRLKK